jgi:nucleotide-binding universal stress UspA family protein
MSSSEEKNLLHHSPHSAAAAVTDDPPQLNLDLENNEGEKGKKGKMLMVVVDGSENSSRAFDVALDFCKDEDTLVICHAVELISESSHAVMATGLIPPVVIDPHMLERTNNSLIDRGKKIVAHYKKKVRSNKNIKFKVKHAVLTSKIESAKECVVSFANKAKFHTIFTGTRGLGSVKSFFMGSFSRYLLSNSEANVMLVH